MSTKLLLAILSTAALFAHSACQTAPPPAKSAPTASNDPTAEEYALYKLAIEDVAQPVEPMPIVNQTVPNHLHDFETDVVFKFVRDSVHGVQKETLEDWWNQNRESKALAYKIDLAHGASLITDKDVAKVPGYPGYAEVSRVGFNADHTQALVYCGHLWKLSGYQGHGFYLVFGKQNERWAITDKLVAPAQ